MSAIATRLPKAVGPLSSHIRHSGLRRLRRSGCLEGYWGAPALPSLVQTPPIAMQRVGVACGLTLRTWDDP